MPANFMFVSKNPIPGSMDDIDEDDDDENDALIPVPLKAAQGVKVGDKGSGVFRDALRLPDIGNANLGNDVADFADSEIRGPLIRPSALQRAAAPTSQAQPIQAEERSDAPVMSRAQALIASLLQPPDETHVSPKEGGEGREKPGAHTALHAEAPTQGRPRKTEETSDAPAVSRGQALISSLLQAPLDHRTELSSQQTSCGRVGGSGHIQGEGHQAQTRAPASQAQPQGSEAPTQVPLGEKTADRAEMVADLPVQPGSCEIQDGQNCRSGKQPRAIRPLDEVVHGVLRGSPRSCQLVAEALRVHGFCVCSGGLPLALVQRAQAEAEHIHSAGGMRAGTVVIEGKLLHERQQNRRGDSVLWLRSSGAIPSNPALSDVEAHLDCFGRTLGGSLASLDIPQGGARCGGVRFTERTDAMLACYPGGGAGYARHVDNADGDGRPDGRKVTMVYYMNHAWDQKAGGSLRIFFGREKRDLNLEHLMGGCRGVSFCPRGWGGRSCCSDGDARYLDVEPRADALVVFRSDIVPHEVMPAMAKRYAMSMWWLGYEQRSPT
ncbi:hypothetical protein CYMTET_22615 [Cymbomonas tetramitiformis]|uniref:Fe2OG dioxygenase domain-containing protein n=1 Tax=Cymbomonas tetramitiformis TaxID=36881 RepID=A0AAE0L1Q8_9CHLO|nr:hypothetical protein CYMTET_22615 [Cymbomonas tetramitiformis]